MMKKYAFAFALTFLLAQGIPVSAQGQGGEKASNGKPGEIRVIVTAAIRVPLDQVRAEAEKAIGHKLVLEYGSARGGLKDEILAGQAFEVSLLLPDVDDEILKAGKV